jgi:hypothetical protein
LEELLKQVAANIESGKITGATLGLENGKRLVIKVESDESLRPFPCPYCSVRAKSQRGLTKHINSNHAAMVG